jgi:hypothetical protein
MANGHGGYRRPANPAPVSGPGANSRRTDGKANMADLPDAQYGENADFREIQSGAALGGGGPLAPPAPIDPATLTPLGAPTAQPDVPVTDGAAVGPGDGIEALGLPRDLDKLDAQGLAKYLPVLLKIAEREDTPAGTKTFVRLLLANL